MVAKERVAVAAERVVPSFLEVDFLKRGMEVTAKYIRLRQLGALAGAEEKPLLTLTDELNE